MKTFQKNLYELRTEKNLSVKELSIILDISEYRVDRLEKGLSKPIVKDLVKLAAYFKVTTDFLIGLSDERNNAKKSNF